MMQRAENQPIIISISIYGGIYAKTFEVPDRGTMIPQHRHTFPHITALMQGAIRVWQDDGPPRDFTAPAMISIPAGSKHLFLTLSGGVVMACLHAADHLEHDEPAVAEEHHLKLED
jgi:quercetin dioxygenase-like cupin family protein